MPPDLHSRGTKFHRTSFWRLTPNHLRYLGFVFWESILQLISTCSLASSPPAAQCLPASVSASACASATSCCLHCASQVFSLCPNLQAIGLHASVLESSRFVCSHRQYRTLSTHLLRYLQRNRKKEEACFPIRLQMSRKQRRHMHTQLISKQCSTSRALTIDRSLSSQRLDTRPATSP